MRTKDDLDSWIPKADAVRTLGIGERTLERIIARGEIRTAHRRIPGRKPLTVLHPDDITNLQKETLAPNPLVPEVVKPQTTALVSRPSRHMTPALTVSDGAEVIPLTVKLFLTVPEAARLSGLPAAYLRRLIASGELAARKAGGWRIKRADLEGL